MWGGTSSLWWLQTKPAGDFEIYAYDIMCENIFSIDICQLQECPSKCGFPIGGPAVGMENFVAQIWGNF